MTSGFLLCFYLLSQLPCCNHRNSNIKLLIDSCYRYHLKLHISRSYHCIKHSQRNYSRVQNLNRHSWWIFKCFRKLNSSLFIPLAEEVIILICPIELLREIVEQNLYLDMKTNLVSIS